MKASYPWGDGGRRLQKGAFIALPGSRPSPWIPYVLLFVAVVVRHLYGPEDVIILSTLDPG